MSIERGLKWNLRVFVSIVLDGCNELYKLSTHQHPPFLLQFSPILKYSCWGLSRIYSPTNTSSSYSSSSKTSSYNQASKAQYLLRHLRTARTLLSLASFTTCRQNGEDMSAIEMSGKSSALKCGCVFSPHAVLHLALTQL